MDELYKIHESICQWQEKERIIPVRKSDKAGYYVLKRLQKLAKAIYKSLPEDLRSKFSVHISTGKSNIPLVLWVSFTPKGNSVYNSMQVTVCFSHSANGSVLGIMDAVTFPQKLLPTKPRDKSKIKVNLNKKGAKYQYNDKFVNPEEFLRHDFSSTCFLKHFRESCDWLIQEYEKQ